MLTGSWVYDKGMTISRLKILTIAALVLAILMPPAARTADQTERPDSAICPVCAIQHLNKTLQLVVAESNFEGRTYYFSSSECKAQFDNNPEYFIELPLQRTAPPFHLQAYSGGRDSTENYRGKIILLDFWASWCAPCVKTMQDLEALYLQHRADSVVVIGITLDSLGNKNVSEHLARNKITYPILWENRTAPTWLQYGVKSLPSLYLIDRQGRIVRQWRGAGDKNEIAAAVDSLLVRTPSEKK